MVEKQMQTAEQRLNQAQDLLVSRLTKKDQGYPPYTPAEAQEIVRLARLMVKGQNVTLDATNSLQRRIQMTDLNAVKDALAKVAKNPKTEVAKLMETSANFLKGPVNLPSLKMEQPPERVATFAYTVEVNSKKYVLQLDKPLQGRSGPLEVTTRGQLYDVLNNNPGAIKGIIGPDGNVMSKDAFRDNVYNPAYGELRMAIARASTGQVTQDAVDSAADKLQIRRGKVSG